MEGLVALAAPGSDVSASGSVSFPPAVATGAPDLFRPEYEASLTAGIKDADPWLFMFGLVLPGAGEGTPLSLSADAKGFDGTHAFSNISGQVSGNGYNGTLTLVVPPAGRAKLGGNLAFDTVSLPVLAEFVTGPGTFGQSFDGLSETEFQGPPVPGIDGELLLSAKRLETGFSEAAESFRAQATMIEGALSLSQISANWLGGQYSGSISLNNLAGSATADLRGTVAGFDMARALAAAGHRGAIAGTGEAAFSLDAEGRSLKGLISGLAGSGNISMRDLVIAGVRSGNLADLFPVTDGEGFVVDNASVAPLAERIWTGGELAVGDVAGTFTVSAGRAAIRNLSAVVSGLKLAGEASGDLGTGETSATITLTPDAGKEALAGAEPAVTFILEGVPGDMGRRTDTSALEGYLSLRAFEQEQRRVEILQAAVLEKQRLRREIIAANARQVRREEERLAEQRRIEELQRRQEAEKLAREEAEALRKAEEEAARKAAEEEAARKAAEEVAARKAAEKKAAEEEAARKAAEEAAARKAEEARKSASQPRTLPRASGPKPAAEIPGGAEIVVEELPPPAETAAPAAKPVSPGNLFENLDRLFQ